MFTNPSGRLGALALLAVAAAGCAGHGVTVSPVRYLSSFGHEYDYAAAGGDFTVVVAGNPFGGDDAAFARRVTTILNQENALQPTNFTTQPGPRAVQRYRAVFVFNSPRRREGELCENTQALRGGPPGAGPVTVHAAFCNGAVAIADVYATASSSDDATFRSLIVQVQNALFPSRSPVGFAARN